MAAPLTDGPGDAGRLAVLASAARALHGERDPDAALAWATQAARDLTGLPEAGICLLPRHGSPTWTTGHPAAGAGAGDSAIDFARVGDPRTSAILRAGLDDGTPTVLADLGTAERNIPVGDRLQLLLPLARLLVVPVMARDGLAQGAILAGDRRPGPIGQGDVDALVALAAHLGIALDNTATLTRMAEVEARGKEVVHALQEAVRPPAPVAPFVELGVHYVAADPSAPTGGDLYDWIVLPDGRLHLVVVDVMGKGVEATKHALSVTHALRLLALEGCPLGDLVARADLLVTAQNPELVATLLIAVYDPATGALQLAGAGHPPALLVHDGDVRELEAPGIPIGWPGAGSHGVTDERLDRADTLIIYTDGLIEATKDIVHGLEDLAAAARATASYPATSLARALVERQLADASRHDDSLALVLRRRAPGTVPTHTLAPFRHQFSPNTAAVPVARHLLRDWLELVPVETDALDGLLLAVSELCSNAVRHATGAPGSVRLEAWTEDDAVVIEVSDDGGVVPGNDPRPATEVPDPEAEQGRGLFLVRELSDELSSRVEDGRSVVRVVKRAVVGVHPVGAEGVLVRPPG
jgi:anti-sigma regulatory factor (Ser/Thr protein kinase)